jgi:hypothetical protein
MNATTNSTNAASCIRPDSHRADGSASVLGQFCLGCVGASAFGEVSARHVPDPRADQFGVSGCQRRSPDDATIGAHVRGVVGAGEEAERVNGCCRPAGEPGRTAEGCPRAGSADHCCPIRRAAAAVPAAERLGGTWPRSAARPITRFNGNRIATTMARCRGKHQGLVGGCLTCTSRSAFVDDEDGAA